MRIHARRAAAIGCLVAAGAVVRAQTPPEATPPATRAVQLPLSGSGGLQRAANQGSVPAAETPGAPLAISLADAVRRGLEANLTGVTARAAVRDAGATTGVARSSLLPSLTAGLTGVDQQTNLAALGFSSIKLPSVGGESFAFPSVIGPYHYVDLRAGVAQSLLDMTRLRNYRAAQESGRAVQLAADDARDVVVEAVTGAYLETIAYASRVDVARAQVTTAEATEKQAADRHDAGLVARIDVTRSQVELLTNRQRLTAAENDLATEKIQFGRLIGLAPGQEFTLSDALPFAPLSDLTLDQALARAQANRADLKSAEAQVHAAELVRHAAVAERYPTAQVSADYGVIGTSPENSHGTFTLIGSLRVPIFDGGRTAADVEHADAALAQRKAEYAELRARIDADVRTAFLNLSTAAQQVTATGANRDLARDTLTQARDRFAAGVTDTLEAVQAQEAVASAEADLISALYAHNLAKAQLARALGQADRNIQQFLGRP